MSKIKSKNTKPEKTVRAYIRACGLTGYRIHWGKAPGKPDICWPGRKVAVFCHGCLWHDHDCRGGKLPQSNVEFWRKKLERNKTRDARNHKELAAEGWKVVTVWECELSTRARRGQSLPALAQRLSFLLGKPLHYEEGTK